MFEERPYEGRNRFILSGDWNTKARQSWDHEDSKKTGLSMIWLGKGLGR
jgi:hypothetical protein